MTGDLEAITLWEVRVAIRITFSLHSYTNIVLLLSQMLVVVIAMQCTGTEVIFYGRITKIAQLIVTICVGAILTA